VSDILGAPYVLDALLLSLKALALAGLLHVALGLPVAYALSQRFVLRGLLEGAITLPLVFPPVALGYFCWYFSDERGVGPPPARSVRYRGRLWLLGGFDGFIPGRVSPVRQARPIGNREPSREFIEASYVLGKGRLKTFWCVILPLAKKA